MASSPPHQQSPPSAPPREQSLPSAPPPQQSPASAPPQQSPASAPPQQLPAPAPPQQLPAPAPPQPPPALAEIAFFDVETTIPSRNTPFSLLEFGAILVCPRRLVEVGSYSTLIRPADLTSISSASVRCNGITPDAVASAPSFCDVADNVFTILDGRVWAGHNIARFDCTRIREAFAEIGRAAPEPRGLIDTLPLLTQRFGRRAGDMKMASLASFFGLGKQIHRSLDDVRMNLEVLKYCATVLFLESSFTDMYSTNGWISEIGGRSQVNGKSSPEGNKRNFTPPSDFCSKRKLWTMECKTILEVNHVAESSMSVQTVLEKEDPSDLISHIAQINIDPSQTASTGEQSSAQSPEIFTSFANSEGSSGHAGFLDPLEVSPQCISASQTSIYQYGCRILLLHKDAPLQLYSMGLRVHFGLSTKFVDHAGRPKLSIVVAVPDNLCQILDSCEHLARKSSLESGSSSEWRPVIKRNGYTDSSLARLNIPIVANDDVGVYSTEIYQKEQSGSLRRIVFSRLNPNELESLFVPGTVIDAFFSVDFYDYQNSAGLRLVAKRLVAHPR